MEFLPLPKRQCALVSCMFCVANLPPAKMQYHLTSKHIRKTFFCATCAKSYFSKTALANHIKKMQCHLSKSKKHYFCDLCSRNFISNNALANHTKKKHALEQFKCDVCSRHFSDKTKLEKHLKNTYIRKRFHCQYCDKSYLSKGAIVKHKKDFHQSAEALNVSVEDDRSCNKKIGSAIKEMSLETTTHECALGDDNDDDDHHVPDQNFQDTVNCETTPKMPQLSGQPTHSHDDEVEFVDCENDLERTQEDSSNRIQNIINELNNDIDRFPGLIPEKSCTELFVPADEVEEPDSNNTASAEVPEEITEPNAISETIVLHNNPANESDEFQGISSSIDRLDNDLYENSPFRLENDDTENSVKASIARSSTVERYQCDACMDNFFTVEALIHHLNSHINGNNVESEEEGEEVEKEQQKQQQQQQQQVAELSQTTNAHTSPFQFDKDLKQYISTTMTSMFSQLIQRFNVKTASGNRKSKPSIAATSTKRNASDWYGKLHRCSKCGMNCKSKKSLMIHMKNRHFCNSKVGNVTPNKSPRACASRNEGLPGEPSSSRHVASHEILKLYYCVKCKIRFPSKESLRQHMTVKHSKNCGNEGNERLQLDGNEQRNSNCDNVSNSLSRNADTEMSWQNLPETTEERVAHSESPLVGTIDDDDECVVVNVVNCSGRSLQETTEGSINFDARATHDSPGDGTIDVNSDDDCVVLFDCNNSRSRNDFEMFNFQFFSV